MSSPAPDALRIRVAGAPDAEAITRIINAAFSIEKFFIDGDRISLPELHALMDKGRFLLGEDQHGPVGCVYIEPREDRAYLGLLSVDPSRQRSGIGSRLVAAAEDYALATGSRYIDLRIVNLRKELPDFYRRLGYVQTGTSQFPGDVVTKLPCHFIEMSKTLDCRV